MFDANAQRANKAPIVVVGANGVIGKDIATRFEELDWPLIRMVRKANSQCINEVEFDLSSDELVELPTNIDSCFLLAAETSMAICAAEPRRTQNINVDNTILLAKRLRQSGAHILYVSTNLVLPDDIAFATADTPVKPQNLYARQKADVESALLQMGGASILRITKLAHSLLPLMDKWYDQLVLGQQIAPFSDLKCAPITLKSVIDSLMKLRAKKLAGIFQISSDEDLSYAQIATILTKTMGVDTALVRPVRSVDAGVRLPSIPRNTTLDVTTSSAQIDFKMHEARQVVVDLAHLVVSQKQK